MILDKLFGREMKETDYIELDTSEMDKKKGKIPIAVERLDDFLDSDRIQKKIRNGAVVLVKIKKLKEKDISELKRAIDKLRKTCVAMNGTIAGIDEDWVICMPAFAHIGSN